MKRLALALFLFAPRAYAAKVDTVPSAESPLLVTSVASRWNEPFKEQCFLATQDRRAIFLRWIPEESMVQRTVIAMYGRESDGKLSLEEAQYASEPAVRVESVGKVRAAKIAEQGAIAVWAYRETDAAVVFIPGHAGESSTTAFFRSGSSCAMAIAIVSTKPASACKTMNGCGRLALLATGSNAITVGFSEDTLAARFTARK